MTTEQELRRKLRKISALFEGATTSGERSAAAAAIERMRKALALVAQTEQPVETRFTLSDHWHRRLFTALCRRYGLECNWLKIAEGHGVSATRATTAEEFYKQFEAAMSTKGPHLIETQVVQNLQPMIDAVYKTRVL